MTDESTSPEQIAEQIIDEVRQLNPELNSEQVIKFSYYVCCKITSEIPMYVGNLNPKWEKFEKAKEIILNSKF